MKPGKADLVRTSLFLLFLLATVPAYCQRGTLDLNVGETSDKFGALAPVTGTVVDLNGELTVIKTSQKNGGPSIVDGGEVRVPTDSANHAKEFAVYGGLAWGVHNFSIGVNAEVRKILMPNCSNCLWSSSTSSVPAAALSSRSRASPNSVHTTKRRRYPRSSCPFPASTMATPCGEAWATPWASGGM